MSFESADAAILSLLALGDRDAALTLLVDTYRDYLRGFVRSNLRSSDAAVDEICAQVWAALARNLPMDLRAPRGFMTAVALHKIANALGERSWAELDSKIAELPAFRSVVSTPFTKLARKEEVELVLGALARLDPLDRQLFAMRYLADQSPTEIATALDDTLSAEAIRKRVARALDAIHEMVTTPTKP